MTDILQASQWTDILDGIDLVRVLTQGGALLACIVGLYALRGVWWGTRKSAVFAGRLVGHVTARSYRFLIPLPPEPPEPEPIPVELANIFDHLEDPTAVWNEASCILNIGELSVVIPNSNTIRLVATKADPAVNILNDFTPAEQGQITSRCLQAWRRTLERDRLTRQAQIPRAKKSVKV